SVFRFVNHVEALERMTAWLAGFITMAFIGGLALICGNYFLGLAANVDVTVNSVIPAILADPSAVGMDIAAWRSIGIVGLAGLLAFLVGYASDDPYPGYGAVQRAYYRARYERERQTKQLRRRINTIVDVAEVEVTEAVRVMKARTNQYAKLVDEAKRMQAKLGDFERALEDSCNLLLDRYRSANESARTTAIPLSFSEHVCFRFEDDSTPVLARRDAERQQEIERDLADFEAKAADIRQELRDLNRRAVDALEIGAAHDDNPG
ncbi:MAG: hypothetical protein OEO82_11360, partial [Gammaproteobacteria bacterium]|nr:hypothetical protein [Gammaproteobacteria bacterium]